MESSKYPLTIVTCLYDLQRKDRSFNQYLEWFTHLLQINCPLACYYDDERVENVLNTRTYETYKVKRELHNISPLFKKYKECDLIREKVKLNSIYAKVPIEYSITSYCLLDISKVFMLKEISNLNPYGSKYFLWIDAGYFRSDPSLNFNLSRKWPDPYKIKHLDKYFVCVHRSFTREKLNIIDGLETKIKGCFQGGSKEQINLVVKDTKKWFNFMLKNEKWINMQQIVSLILHERFNDFVIYKEDSDIQDEIRQFAVGTNLKIDYPICNKLLLLTVASKEINQLYLNKFEKTAQYFGYKYEILGREENWKGWDYRTKKYLARIKDAIEDVIMLTDSTDVIFTGAAYETYHKILSQPHDILIGGESMIFYSDASDYYKYEDTLIKRCQSRFCYPNGGLVVGNKKSLIELLTLNQHSKDDQAGYIRLSTSDPYPFSLDYDTLILGNLPNMGNYNNREIEFWEYDPVDRRHYNRLNYNKPTAFHFPGKNFEYMDVFYNKMELNYEKLDANNLNRGNVSIGAFFVFILLIFILIAILHRVKR